MVNSGLYLYNDWPDFCKWQFYGAVEVFYESQIKNPTNLFMVIDLGAIYNVTKLEVTGGYFVYDFSTYCEYRTAS